MVSVSSGHRILSIYTFFRGKYFSTATALRLCFHILLAEFFAGRRAHKHLHRERGANINVSRHLQFVYHTSSIVRGR